VERRALDKSGPFHGNKTLNKEDKSERLTEAAYNRKPIDKIHRNHRSKTIVRVSISQATSMTLGHAYKKDTVPNTKKRNKKTESKSRTSEASRTSNQPPEGLKGKSLVNSKGRNDNRTPKAKAQGIEFDP
jgi:hypothetical protein